PLPLNKGNIQQLFNLNKIYLTFLLCLNYLLNIVCLIYQKSIMKSRRNFLKNLGLSLGSLALIKPNQLPAIERTPIHANPYPVAISTWEFGLKANAEAFPHLLAGGTALDAVEKGVKVVE